MNMNKKKLFAVYGNCQSEPLKSFLLTSQEFSSRWESLEIPAIHLMTNEQLDSFKNNLNKLSLVIYQNVKRGEFSTENILNSLPSHCCQISIPSLFFNGYNPEIAYLRQSRSQLFYHDRIMLKHIEEYETFCKLLLSDDYFSKSFSLDCVNAGIEELEIREHNQNLTIIISDFIQENFRKARLFHILNHPTSILLKELANRILCYLGISANFENTDSVPALDGFQFPIYRSHYQNLDLEFENEIAYIWAGRTYSLQDFFSLRKKQYSKIDLDFARNDEFAFRKPSIRGWDLAGELKF